MTRAFVSLVACVLFGCPTGLPPISLDGSVAGDTGPDTGADAGFRDAEDPDGSTTRCDGLSKLQCAARNCEGITCGCPGQEEFICHRRTEPVSCPAIACPTCAEHLDRTSCEADPKCAALVCDECGFEKLTCYDNDGAVPGCGGSCPTDCSRLSESECPGDPACAPCYFESCLRGEPARYQGCVQDSAACRAECPSCDSLGLDECRSHVSCDYRECLSCNGSLQVSSCFDETTAHPDCPTCSNTACHALGETDCHSSSVCHPVFVPDTEGNARFLGCAGPDAALCRRPPTFNCDVPEPRCGGDYTVAYTPSCYQGCVLESDCLL